MPGVSGGSMAMILNIYDRLIHAVSSFFKKPLKNIIFLGIFCVGALLGFLVCVTPLSYLLEHYPNPTSFFFLGAVAGGIPMIVKKAGIKKFSPIQVVWVVLGGAVVVALSFLPSGLLDGGVNGVAGILIQVAAGVLISIALVLPGISTSHMLLVMGIYSTVLDALKQRSFLSLVPLAIGAVLGVFLVTKVLEIWMTRYPTSAYMTVFGFLLASLYELLPKGMVFGWQIILYVVCAVAGFFAILFLSRMDTDEAAALVTEKAEEK